MLFWLVMMAASTFLLAILYGWGALLLTYFCAAALHNFMEDSRRWAVPEDDQQKDSTDDGVVLEERDGLHGRP